MSRKLQSRYKGVFLEVLKEQLERFDTGVDMSEKSATYVKLTEPN